ncbi:hypothetical protein AMK20_06095 [Streptomyces sp. TSRI0261]|nr:hypothetical protein AMK20_06095 [Streptomyces sp. TSRI0261]
MDAVFAQIRGVPGAVQELRPVPPLGVLDRTPGARAIEVAADACRPLLPLGVEAQGEVDGLLLRPGPGQVHRPLQSFVVDVDLGHRHVRPSRSAPRVMWSMCRDLYATDIPPARRFRP